MARRFWIGFYSFAFAVFGSCGLIANLSLAKWRMPLREVLGVFLPFDLLLGWMMSVTFGLLRREIARSRTNNSQ